MSDKPMTFEEWYAAKRSSIWCNWSPIDLQRLAWNAAMSQSEAERDRLMQEVERLKGDHMQIFRDAKANADDVLRAENAELRMEVQRGQEYRDRLHASHKEMLAALEWYVQNDDCGPDDDYYLQGFYAAEAAIKNAKEV